jgi:hypothetical protein
MQLDAILCNHVESVNNLLYIAGGGVDRAVIPPGMNPPYPIALGIGVMVTVPWQQTNQQHQVEIDLMDEDGDPVTVSVGPDATAPLHAQLIFNVGRPPGLMVGDEQHVCLAANMPGIPMPKLGKYEFVIRLDGSDERRLAYRIASSQGTQMVVGPTTPPGPSSFPFS